MIRLEKKYILNSEYERLRLIKFLYKNGFKNIYKDRTNFSIYFDYRNLKYFIDSEEGLAYRTKLRLRVDNKYFKNDYNKFNFEIKKSNPYFKKKITFKNDLESKLSSLHSEKKIYENEIISKKLIPILSTKYERSYFYSKKYGRITIDKNLEYQSVYWSKFMKEFGFKQKKKDKRIVIEHKIENKLSENDFIKLVPTRISKYCEGVKYLNL
jgi:hypothetical protein|tara:strand:+ start:3815 stop:4447 length:633 start_codon:yes stop_codon:yes gene_type:complete